ncbi:hypothetical protein Tco_0375284, partial [Tanacetum coccineum]
EPDESLFHAWERFKELLMKCPRHYLTDMQEVILFYNGLDVPTRQILDSKGAIPSKTVADAKVAIQEMAEYSQKWHNGTSSRTRSTETFDGLAAIQAQLKNLGREIKKVNEKVYAAQVGCELCKGPHYTKDCLQKEEGKTLEEAYYTQFGAPYQPGGQYKASRPGFYQRNNGKSSYPDRYHPQTHIPLRPNLGVLQIGIKSQGYREPDLVMSDSEDFTVTYTEVSSPFEDLPPSLDYVPGPKEPEQAPPLPEFVPDPVYPEFMPPKDEEDEEDPKEDPEEDPADYPANGGDDDDDESSDDDEDDYDDDVEEDEDDDDKEEEEHPTLADSVPPPVHQIDRLLSIPSPPPSPLSPLSSPLPRIPSPLLPVSSLVPVSPPPLPASPTYPLGYRAAMIRLRAESPSISYLLLLGTPPSGTPPLLPIPIPTSSPPLLLPSTDYRADMPEVCLPARKRMADYGFVGTLDDEIRRDPEREVGYGIIDTWDDMVEDMQGTLAVTDVAWLSQRMTDFFTTVKQDIDEIYSMDASDTARSKVRALRTTVLAQHAEIGALRAADRTQQAHLTEALTLMRTLQTQVTVTQVSRTA